MHYVIIFTAKHVCIYEHLLTCTDTLYDRSILSMADKHKSHYEPPLAGLHENPFQQLRWPHYQSAGFDGPQINPVNGNNQHWLV